MEKIPEKDQVILDIIDDASDEIRQKYPLSPAGFGMNHGFERITISFELFKNKSRDELRPMLLNAAQIFLRKLNESKKARALLPNFPATEKNIGITIYLSDENRNDLFHPDFFCASITGGELSFLSSTKENSFVVHEKITETYEEATKLVNAQGKTP